MPSLANPVGVGEPAERAVCGAIHIYHDLNDDPAADVQIEPETGPCGAVTRLG